MSSSGSDLSPSFTREPRRPVPSRGTWAVLIRDVLPLYLITRFLIFVVGRLSVFVIIKGKDYGQVHGILDLFYRWDGRWFMSVVNNGYVYTPGRHLSNVVFFPLYPLLIKVTTFVVRDLKIAGFLISNIALIAALVFLVKLIRLDYPGSDIAGRAVRFALVFPASLYFSVVYSEGLFLALAAGCLYYARLRKWAPASILGGLLALTRSLWVLVFIPLLIEYLDIDWGRFRLSLRKIRPDILWLLLVPAGLLSYMTFLYLKFGDPLLFLKAHAQWGRKIAPIWSTVQSYKHFPNFYRVVFIATLVVFLALIVYGFLLRLRLSYFSFILANFAIIMSSALIEAIPRYLAAVVPIYLVLALAAMKSKFFDEAWTFLSWAFLVVFTILYVNGYWMT